MSGNEDKASISGSVRDLITFDKSCWRKDHVVDDVEDNYCPDHEREIHHNFASKYDRTKFLGHFRDTRCLAFRLTRELDYKGPCFICKHFDIIKGYCITEWKELWKEYYKRMNNMLRKLNMNQSIGHAVIWVINIKTYLQSKFNDTILEPILNEASEEQKNELEADIDESDPSFAFFHLRYHLRPTIIYKMHNTDCTFRFRCE